MISEFNQLVLPHIFKNNEEICKFLGEKYNKSTGSRRRIEKILDQYCTWNKDKRKYIVTAVHEEVQKYEDGRVNNNGGNNVKYADDMDDLILWLLDRDYGLDLPISGWMTELGWNNKLYSEFMPNIKEISDKYNYYESYGWDFFSTVRSVFSKQITSSFNRLEKNHPITVWCRKFIVNENGEHVEATTDQIIEIEKIEDKWLEFHECKNEQETIIKGKYYDYKDDVIESLKDIDIYGLYNKYDVSKTGSGSGVSSNIFREESFHFCSNHLHNEICNGIIENANNRQEKARKQEHEHNKRRQTFDGDTFDGIESDRLPSHIKAKASLQYDYAYFYETMVDKYVRNGASKLVEDITIEEDEMEMSLPF